jgi:hypothetical protein
MGSAPLWVDDEDDDEEELDEEEVAGIWMGSATLTWPPVIAIGTDPSARHTSIHSREIIGRQALRALSFLAALTGADRGGIPEVA